MRKKSLWIFLTVLIIVAVSAIFLFLQSSIPEHSVKQFFKSFKTQDKESMRHVYTADILSIAQNRLEEAVASGIDAAIEQESASARKYDSKAIVSEAQKKILDFEYDIKSSEVSGNQASVVVEITSYELGNAYREWYLESKQIKFSGEGSSGRKNIALRLNLLEQKFKESTKTYKSVFEIKLTKKHGDWMISDMGDSYEFLRAVSGAFIYS